MTDVLMQRIKEIELMPISGLSVYGNDGEGAAFTVIRNIESESSYSITPITRVSSRGGDIVIGYRAQVTIYVPFSPFAKFGEGQNDEEIHALARIIRLAEVELYPDYGVDTHITLGNTALGGGSLTGVNMTVNSTHQAVIDFGRMQMTWRIESAEFRPRTILDFKSVIPRSNANITINTGSISFNNIY